MVHVDDLNLIPEISYYEEAHSNDQQLHKMAFFLQKCGRHISWKCIWSILQQTQQFL